ncbi:hypothetical protein WG906_19240 [Pedobacter sp. P351]
MADEKAKHNHTGQTPSDIPSEKLKHSPPKKGRKKTVSKSNSNTKLKS